MRHSSLVVAAILPIAFAVFEPLLPNQTMPPSWAAPKSDKSKSDNAAAFFKAFDEQDLFVAERLFNQSRGEQSRDEQASEIAATQALVYARCQSLPQCLNLIRDYHLYEKPDLTSDALANLTLGRLS